METEKVMDKLRDEMAAKHGEPGIQIIGEAMTRMLRLSPDTAEAVGAEGKTLAGAFAAVRSWAEKHKTGNSCFVPPAQAVEIVCGYYGIAPIDLLARAVRELMMEQAGETAEEPQALAEAVAPEKRGGEAATVRERAAQKGEQSEPSVEDSPERAPQTRSPRPRGAEDRLAPEMAEGHEARSQAQAPRRAWPQCEAGRAAAALDLDAELDALLGDL